MQKPVAEEVKPKIPASEPAENPIIEENPTPIRQKTAPSKPSEPVKVILLYSDGTFESFEK